MKTQFISDSFVDFNGVTRKFIVAAVPCEKEDFYFVNFGVSFQHPKDKFNEELGKRIAEGKAIKVKTRIGSCAYTSKMFIKSEIIDIYLKRFTEIIKKSPEKFSNSYKSALDKHNKKKQETDFNWETVTK